MDRMYLASQVSKIAPNKNIQLLLKKYIPLFPNLELAPREKENELQFGFTCRAFG
jgi:hypothetical protein